MLQINVENVANLGEDSSRPVPCGTAGSAAAASGAAGPGRTRTSLNTD